MHLAFDDRRETGVWQHRNRQRGALTKVTNAFSHVARSGATVHADNVNRKRRECRQRSANLGAVEHRSEHLDGDLRNHGHAPAILLEVFEDCRQRRFCLQQILAGFDNQQVGAAIEQPTHLFSVRRL